MGFDGKTLIHPKQLDVANQVYGPSRPAVAWAQRIIDAHDDASRAGKGVVVVDGRLIENLHVQDARRTIALANAIGDLEASFS